MKVHAKSDRYRIKRVDLFAFGIAYNDPQHGGTPLYNGNISETEWRTANTDSSSKWYRYEFDALNRINSATDNTGNYSLSNVTYDKNGNIQSLTRSGWQGGSTYTDMDVLDYDYDSGNKLLKVADTGNDGYGFKDDAVNTSDILDDYSYDPNGNMTRDDNKGITSVEYNHLNMPTKVTVTGSNAGVLDYVYDATGVKLRKSNSNGTITDYIGNYVYEGGSLKQISHPEGYIEPNGSSWQYVYYLKDLQNNVRITFADDNDNGSIDPTSEIRREQNYFPFGMEHGGYNNSSYGVENNLKTYQDQEFTNDLGLDTHEWRYRVSDPATGRFWQVDPLAEDYVYNGTYNFSENRVVDGVELEGLEYRPANRNLRRRPNVNFNRNRSLHSQNRAGASVSFIRRSQIKFREEFKASDLESVRNMQRLVRDNNLLPSDPSESVGHGRHAIKTLELLENIQESFKSEEFGNTGFDSDNGQPLSGGKQGETFSANIEGLFALEADYQSQLTELLQIDAEEGQNALGPDGKLHSLTSAKLSLGLSPLETLQVITEEALQNNQAEVIEVRIITTPQVNQN